MIDLEQARGCSGSFGAHPARLPAWLPCISLHVGIISAAVQLKWKQPLPPAAALQKKAPHPSPGCLERLTPETQNFAKHLVLAKASLAKALETASVRKTGVDEAEGMLGKEPVREMRWLL